MDTAGAACPYELRITVGEGEMAVAAGQLLRQTWAGAGRRTFHYRLQHATPPCHLALAVGELKIIVMIDGLSCVAASQK